MTPIHPGRVPSVLRAQQRNTAAALGDGLVDAQLKELCARYLTDDPDVVAHAGDPQRFSERERAALAWTHAIAWDADHATDEVWAQLHRWFDEAELVELGYAIAFMFGQQRWLATLEP
jgi:alkylhydroperoxidase family enzyme